MSRTPLRLDLTINMLELGIAVWMLRSFDRLRLVCKLYPASFRSLATIVRFTTWSSFFNFFDNSRVRLHVHFRGDYESPPRWSGLGSG